MRNRLILLVLLVTPLFSYAQHNYDNQSVIYSNGGNVGIGTTSPTQRLFIQGSGNYNNSNAAAIALRSTAANRTIELHALDDGGFQIADRTNGSTLFWITTQNNFLFTNGNVGIGITNPTYKLTVDGTISAKEVKVSTTPNSDYVFEPDYPLLPLSEVETHIKEKKHLPGIPSAEEFKQNGVGLGEMDDMLLRKVEELTLYVIEQQKEMLKLKEENAMQRKENEQQNELIQQQFELINKLTDKAD